MTDETAFLIEWVEDLRARMKAALSDASAEELAWRPDAEANNVGETAWHMNRWLDVLATRTLGGEGAADEVWQTRGWVTRTAYDPRGIGEGGLGTLTGYSLNDVRALPVLGAGDHLAYLEQACDALAARLRATTGAALRAPAPGRSRSAYDTVRSILVGCFGHLGEIEALRAMRRRPRPAIAMEPNGPYLVSGPATLRDSEGREHHIAAGKTARLCRCGHSANKPFCDDSHRRVDFVSRPHFRPE